MRTLSVLILLTALNIASANAAEPDDLDSCATWNTMDRSAKGGFVLGWAKGVKSAGVIADEFVKTRTVPKVGFGVESIIDKVLWPTGHRFGSVIIELNVECSKSENLKQSISGSIVEIARRLNVDK
jgi:hypothetical protein